jgi:hypothetical protein
VIAIGASAFVAGACADGDKSTTMNTTTSATMTRGDWDAARGRTIFFGHQSVGENILDGLRQIATAEKWPALTVVENTNAPNGPAVIHGKVGANGDPTSKIVGFKQALDAGAGANAEIALMKFCFWDIRADTNVDKVFAEYQKTMSEIGRSYPNLTLLHATVPLVVEDRDWRARVRRMIGSTVPTDLDNARREALNQKIRATYGDRVFDIARAEQEPGASGEVPYLAASLSSDGAHLNDAGRRQVASEFVRTVASVSRVGATR